MLGWIDYTILAAYFVVILGIGLWVGRREKTTEDYFLGGRRQHWLLAGLSIVAAEVSALTYIGVPADAFRGDWNYLQMYFGSFAGRVLIVLFLLPAFYGGSVTTVYQYLGQRFGPWTQITASLFFIASRVLGSGIRLLVASLAVAVVFDWPLAWVIVIAAGVAIVYATVGGIKSIMWTEAMQAVLFIGAAFAAIAYMLWTTPGAWWSNIESAMSAGKTRVFTFDLNPNNDRSFWVLFIHATFLNMAAMGCDQDLTQRMLTCPDLRRGQRSLMFNAIIGFPIVCSFLLIGSMMFVFFNEATTVALPPDVVSQKDRVFPYFIAHALPNNVGLRGLLVTGIFAASMGSLAPAVGALSSTAVTDFYRRFVPAASDRHYLWAARWFAGAFGVVLVLVAFAFAKHDDLLWNVFRWVSLVFGGLLGVFLLGVLTRTRGSDRSNVLAMLSSVALLVAIKLFQDSYGIVYVAWPWWVVIGTLWTIGLGACFATKNVDRRRIVRKDAPAVTPHEIGAGASRQTP